MSPHLCITVVEDNENLCAVTVELLRQQGHRVAGVTSAEALGDEHAGQQIDVLLVDLNLPGEDGFSLVRRYRAACPGLTVIVISSRDRLDDRLACYRMGADAFIAKPTHPDELLAIIEVHARRRLQAREPGPETVDSARVAQLDMRRMRLSGPTGEVEIGGAAAKVLSALALAPGGRLAYWQLIEALGENAETYTLAALAVRVVRLRHLLRRVGFEGETVRALRSEGYQLCVKGIVV